VHAGKAEQKRWMAEGPLSTARTDGRVETTRGHDMRIHRVLIVVVAMLAASSTSGISATASPGADAADTAVPATITTEPASDSEVTLIRDIVYLEMDGHEYLADVYVPAGAGPWPVVVALHGALVFKDHPETTVIAQAAAEAGMLVFAPNWVAAWPSLGAMDAEFVRAEEPAYRCALAFAQHEAASYGGDPERSVVYGHSGGATSASHLVLHATTDLAPGCLAQTLPMTPVGAVLGDAEYFFHPAWWDGAFKADTEEMQAIVAEAVDPASWPIDLPTRFRLWAAADGSFPRSFDDPWDEHGWFAQRDPDGTIREDLDELGELDDGVISYIDAGLLLAARLRQAGIDTTFDVLPGGHDAPDNAPELVAYLLDAAGSD